MNQCRLCEKPIPVRLCFCTGCTKDRLLPQERIELMWPRAAAERERLAQAVLDRIKGASTTQRPSRAPPANAAESFRETRRLLAPVLGKGIR